ncbi:hypothetical protein XENTR_v10002619 [Xenopus tropicalis]|uniref:Transmembrane protein 17B n=2 Tax=Xenopus tropicalis TaxID=8364 RepID=TM17B_XENTR|nr:transmembrane protein 17B [Xenopus tropicalis]F6RWY9.2 RecName: Full=Transmembrane protein 17B [Xenopus tropicalis]KAE8635445.1 hypothetical protein XENTR_v10002619 [Xenopus tropicalis]|eukprot:XP_002931754.1 PREDICTED: transmembrane protein 17B [Xenopus tropicalis]
MALLTPLPGSVRHGLARISGSLFIQNKTRDCGEQHAYQSGHDLLSSLPLQMMLYFNAFFFPFWIISEIITMELKFGRLSGYYQILLTTSLVILTLVESLRLYIGYVGNLHEKVPELAGFLILTLLIQLPLLLFLLTDNRNLLLPLDLAVHMIYLMFINAEIVISFLVLKTMTRQFALEYYLQQSEILVSKHVPVNRTLLRFQNTTTSIAEQYGSDALMY